MKTSAFLSALALLAAIAAATPVTTVPVTYDQTYDIGANILDDVACGNGPNGLENLGFTSFKTLPNFLFIGGASVAAFGSPDCGSCWQLTFEGASVNVLVIDHAAAGFNIALEAMNALTNGNAVNLGKVNATAVQLTPADCGL